MILGAAFLFGIVLAVMLMAYEDGVSFGLLRRLSCKFDRHTHFYRVDKITMQRYFCKFCRKPRKHPPLKVIDGGKKFRDNGFKF